jgi:DNA-binding GntR family transcriptional regulator
LYALYAVVVVQVISTNAISPNGAQSVYLALRRRFADGDLGPNERLTEAALAQELGVSRTPVREALGRLLADGLVVPAARGVAVATLSGTQVAQIYRLRASLEGLAAAEAATRQAGGLIAPVELRGLREAADAVERAIGVGDVKGSTAANLGFHRVLGRLAANPFLEDALHRVWDRIAVAMVSNLTDEAWAAKVIAQHRAIADAVLSGKPDAARIAAEEHIESAADIYQSSHGNPHTGQS